MNMRNIVGRELTTPSRATPETGVRNGEVVIGIAPSSWQAETMIRGFNTVAQAYGTMLNDIDNPPSDADQIILTQRLDYLQGLTTALRGRHPDATRRDEPVEFGDAHEVRFVHGLLEDAAAIKLNTAQEHSGHLNHIDAQSDQARITRNIIGELRTDAAAINELLQTTFPVE